MKYAEVWRRACLNHYFELECAKAIDEKLVTCPTYLSLGQEIIPAVFGTYFPDYPIFAQHRCHSWYLSYGGDPYRLALELLGSSEGCAGGMGGSASIHIPGKMFGHDGLLGSNAPIAVGYARATQKPVICVLGDAAVEEDYVFGAFTVAARDKVPILFIVEDNGLSILTKTEVRRSWDVVKVAEAFNIEAQEKWDQLANLLQYANIQSCVGINSPKLFNILTERHRWHAGSGIDAPPRHDNFDETRRKMAVVIPDSGAIEIWAKCEAQFAWEKAKEVVRGNR